MRAFVLQEQRLRYLKLQDQPQQQQQQQEPSEEERLQQLRENANNQEAKLRRVRALRGQVEQKRLSNSKLGRWDGGAPGGVAANRLCAKPFRSAERHRCECKYLLSVEEIEQMTGLFQQKQRELLVAVSRVEELSDQLEELRSNRLEAPTPPPPIHLHHNTSSAAELERLYKELQVRTSLEATLTS